MKAYIRSKTPILILLLPLFAVWGFFLISYSKDLQIPTKHNFPCVSYAPKNIQQAHSYTKEEITDSLIKLRKIAPCVRTYSSINGLEQVPGIAESLGMDAMIGAWLEDEVHLNNEKEIASIIKLSKEHSNILAVIVSNEALLMERLSEEYLLKQVDRVQKEVEQPVTVAEPFIMWNEHPELLKHVDFMGLHKLSYWEGALLKNAVFDINAEIDRAEYLLERKRIDLPIYMLEIGWPTNGPNEDRAVTGVREQNQYLYETTSILEQRGIFYNVVDGLDVPSKYTTTEGLVGPHWGVLNKEGNTKYSFPLKALVELSLIYVLAFFLMHGYANNILKVLGVTSNKSLWIYVWIAIYSLLLATALANFYPLYGSGFILFQVFFTIIITYSFIEFNIKTINIIAGKNIIKYLREQNTDSLEKESLVSILIAAKDESAEQIIKTINSCLAQTHPNTEVLYLDNNSHDDSSFNKVKKHFENSESFKNEKLKLFFEEKVTHFKAGALNYLLKHVSEDSNIVSVLDSDYIVHPDWTELGLTYFKKDTGFVQFPQSYERDDAVNQTGNRLIIEASAMEQKLVFDSLYPTRSLIGSIVQNGTMVMIRKEYLRQGWPTWTICEDAALGASIDQQGGQSVFVPTIKGSGLAPESFEALTKQRYRWVFGSTQILKRSVIRFKDFKLKTILLYVVDWLTWIMHMLYPPLLLSSFGFIVFAWLIYLHTQLSWVIFIGFGCIVYSLLLFAISYFNLYSVNKKSIKLFIKLLIMQLALVNTICYAMLSSLFKYSSVFALTREKGIKPVTVFGHYFKKSFIKRIVGLGMSTILGVLGIMFLILLTIIDVPKSVRVVAAVQLLIVLLPQAAYFYLIASEKNS